MFRGARSLSSSASSIVKKSLFLPQTSFSMRANGPISEPKLQPEICDRLYKWQDSRADSELWVLHDGPPYANGDLHIGHFLNKVLKDIVNRYKLLRGCRIHYVPGWDCHGLPIELKALEKARKNCKSGVLSPQEIRNLAREWAQKHVESQKKEFRRWGILADWENAYKTMDKEYEALQIKVFRNLVERGFVYRALKPVYWSPSSQTALAEAELEYVDDHVSQAAYVGYSLTEKAREKISELVSSSEILHKLSGNIQAVIWTTTPWTIPASMAVAFGRDLEYAILRDKTNGNCLLVAKDCVKNLEHFEFEEIFILSGKHLSGLVARHPFLDREVPFLESEFVLADSGTGLVHTAPGHGREDFIIGQRNDLPTVSVVNENGQFTSAAGKDLEGLKISGEGTEKVMTLLESSGSLIHQHKYRHRYPYDWRTKKPVIQRATQQWFIEVKQLQNDAVNSLEKVQIIPEFGRTRLTSTLLSRSEWCISRQRTWGVPIPVFYYNESGEPLVDPAILEHVECLFQEYGSDCWWSMEIEELLPESFKHQANLLRKGPDTMDVWFDSGVSWISALLPRGVNIPVDLVVEGSDQHRGWFQSSLLTSMASTGTPSYKAILSHGFVLDEKLQKMSKSLGNVISPSEIILGKWKQNKDLSGAELLRLWAASTDFTNDVTIGPLILSKCSTTLRKCRNTLRFLLSALNDYVPKDNHSLVDVSSFPPVEQYILKSLLEFASKAESGYEKFEFCRVVKLIENFVSNDLSAFYFTVSKDTLYCQSKDSILRLNTQHAMMEILSVLTKVISPILPHLAQEVFNNLPERLRPFLGYSENELESLFTCGWVDIKRYSSLERVDFESWKSIFRLRAIVLQKLEKSRADGIFSGDFSNASVSLRFSKQYPCPSMNILDQLLDNDQLNAFFGVSHVEICKESMSSKVDLDERIQSSDAIDYSWSESEVMIASAKGTKCFRCWRICQDTQPKEIAGESCEICHRCRKVMDTLDWNQV